MSELVSVEKADLTAQTGLEPCAVSAPEPLKLRKPWQFTPERARQLAERSIAVRAAKRALIRSGAVLTPLPGQEQEQASKQPPEPILNETEAIQEQRRDARRLKLRLNRLDVMMDEETDPQKLDRLASARHKLFEGWRILAGIPMPGSRKPAPDRAPSRTQSRIVPETE